MRRANNKGNKFAIICIGTSIIIAISLLIVGKFILFPEEQTQGTTSSEIVVERLYENPSQTASKETKDKPIEVKSVEYQTLNQQPNHNLSASKQSSLEKAIEDLIILTDKE